MEHNLTLADFKDADTDLENIQWNMFEKNLRVIESEMYDMLLKNGYLA